MAAPSGSTGGGPLEEWRKDIPPHWHPGIESYPLKLYFSKLKLWYRCAEAQMIGPYLWLQAAWLELLRGLPSS